MTQKPLAEWAPEGKEASYSVQATVPLPGLSDQHIQWVLELSTAYQDATTWCLTTWCLWQVLIVVRFIRQKTGPFEKQHLTH